MSSTGIRMEGRPCAGVVRMSPRSGQNVLVQRNTALFRVPRGIDDQPQVSSMTVVKHLVSFEKH